MPQTAETSNGEQIDDRTEVDIVVTSQGVESLIMNCDFSTVHSQTMIEIDGLQNIWALAFLNDSKCIVSGGTEGKIRVWQVEDGKQVGKPMHVGQYITSIATSKDGKWIVGGSKGIATIWNATTYEKVAEIKGHKQWLDAVDISPDGTKIAIGSNDKLACVWSLLTRRRLHGPWMHANRVAAVKFSPNGRLLAVSAPRESVQIHDIENDCLPVNASVRPSVSRNGSIAWGPHSKQLFVLSIRGVICCLDALEGTTLFQWPIHSKSYNNGFISIAKDGRFIAASTSSSLSFWDTKTLTQIGHIIPGPDRVGPIVISEKYGIVNGAGRMINYRELCDILPSSYVDGYTANKRVRPEDINRSLCTRLETADKKIVQLEERVRQLRAELLEFQQDASLLRVHEHKLRCEPLYAEGRIIDAANSFSQMTSIETKQVMPNNAVVDWLIEFTNRCTSKLEIIGDEQASSGKHDEAFASYSTALSFSPSTSNTLLTKWVTIALSRGLAEDVLRQTTKFKPPQFSIYRLICENLDTNSRVKEAVECFRQMRSELSQDVNVPEERVRWEADFRDRFVDKLEKLGDAAMESLDHDTAAECYTDALTLDPTNRFDILLKQSKVQSKMGLWDSAISSADKAIEIDPSSPHGYDRKRLSLFDAQRYDEATLAYNNMLLELEQSADPVNRELRNQYVSTSEIITAIRASFKRHQRDIPLVLINTRIGILCNEDERMAEFEADKKFKELLASMTKIDEEHINQTVEEYLRYATLSHTWEKTELLYQDFLHYRSVYNLPKSPASSKLVKFCRIARQAGLRWAWADTCCINKMDGSVLQESLTSMFKWYHNSFLTIIHLKGVLSDSDITISTCLWNKRAWTLQEFFASEVIQFYTEDWKPYITHGVVYNHKESDDIMVEMANATGVDAQDLLSLRPGSDWVRQKLCLSATRVAAKQEDMAYSLFGIFDVFLSVIYGEGQESALGRLLQEVSTRSGDITVLAWIGKASEYNSGIPAEISVYREPVSLFIPSLSDDEVDILVAALTISTSSPNLDSVMTPYDRVSALPPPYLASRRLRLSCIIFPIRGLSVSDTGRQRVYCGTTSALEKVEIETTDDLATMGNLVLVHPWIQCLVDPSPPFEPWGTNHVAPPLTPVNGDGPDYFTHAPSPSHTVSPSLHSAQPHLDKYTRSLRYFVRLKQPFGALLLVPLSLNEYRRVACDRLIKAQLLDNVSPGYLVERIRTLDIL